MITKDMKVTEAIETDRRCAIVFQRYGMGCIHCLAASVETIEQAAQTHGLNVDELLDALNKQIEE